jgi:hypothetical protein
MNIRTRTSIKLDLSKDLENIAGVSVFSVASAIRDAWAEEAKSRLNTTAKDYISSIRTEFRKSASEFIAEIYLEGKWANALEQGFGPFDMKPGFARSSKRKISQENQWYLHIPFRHTAHTATGKSGRPMPSAIYRKASQLPQWGRLQLNRPPATSWTGYQHKSDIYDGLTKVPESRSSTRSAYFTWRTVSENSDPNAFIHPGFEGVHIADSLIPYVQDTFSQVFASNIQHVLGDNRGR